MHLLIKCILIVLNSSIIYNCLFIWRLRSIFLSTILFGAYLFYLNQGNRAKNFYIYIDLFAVSHSVINRMINSGKKVSSQVSSSIIVNQTFCTRNVYIDNMIKSTYYIWNYFLSFSTNEYDHLLDYVNILGLKKLRIALINPNLFPTSYLFHSKLYIYIACLSNNLLMLSANWISLTTPFSCAVFFYHIC